MPSSSEAAPEVQPVSVQGRSESKTEPLEEFVEEWKAHMQTIGEKRPHPEPKCAPSFDPRSVELPPPAPWHKEERKAADNVTRTPTNTFKRTDEVKYQKLSKAMARIQKDGGEDDHNEDKAWYLMSEVLDDLRKIAL